MRDLMKLSVVVLVAVFFSVTSTISAAGYYRNNFYAINNNYNQKRIKNKRSFNNAVGINNYGFQPRRNYSYRNNYYRNCRRRYTYRRPGVYNQRTLNTRFYNGLHSY